MAIMTTGTGRKAAIRRGERNMKKRRWKRGLALVLSLLMLCSLLPMSVFAENGSTDPNELNLLVLGASTSSGYGLSDYINHNAGFAADKTTGRDNDKLYSTWKVSDALQNEAEYQEEKSQHAYTADWTTRRKGRISEKSYPWQLKQYMAETTGKTVNLNAMTLNGMRTDELRGFLDESYAEKMYSLEKKVTYVDDENVGFFTDHMRSFVDCLGDGGAKVDTNGNGTPETKVWKPGESREPLSEPYFRAQKYFKDEIKKADVIVFDVSMNNFGTYLAERIAGQFGIPGKEYGQNYHKQTLDDIDGVDDRLWSEIKVLRKEIVDNAELLLGEKYAALAQNEIIQEFLDSFIYCFADFATNFSADLELIRKINPNAKIITVGVYNTLEGVQLKIGDTMIDFGGITSKGFEAVNLYIKAFDKNSPNYYYADVLEGDSIETFMNQIGRAKDLEELLLDKEGKSLMDNMYESFVEMFVGNEAFDAMIEDNAESQFDAATPNADGSALEQARASFNQLLPLLNGLNIKDTADASNVTWKDLGTLLATDDATINYALTLADQYQEGVNDAATIKAQIEGGMSQILGGLRDFVKTRVQQLLFDAAHYKTLDLPRLMENLQDMNVITNSVMAYIAEGTKPSDSIMEILHIVDRFILYMGIGQHPSEKGCAAMTTAVKKAYDKAANGGYTAYEEVFRDLAYVMAGIGMKLKDAYDAGEFDEILANIQKAKDLIDKVDLDKISESLELVEQLKAYKEQLEGYITQFTEKYSAVIADLVAKGKDLLDSGVEKAFELLNDLYEMVQELPSIKEKIETKINGYINELTEAFGAVLDELKAKAQAIVDAVDVEQVTAVIRKVDAFIHSLPTPKALKEKIEQMVQSKLAEIQALVREKAAQITEGLYNQIISIAGKIKDAVTGKDYDAIAQKLMPILEQLKKIAMSVVALPEYEKAMDEMTKTVERLAAESAGLSDDVLTLQAQVGEMEEELQSLRDQVSSLSAKTIGVDIKSAVSFPSGKVQVKVSWTADESTAGFVFKVGGKETKYSASGNGGSYVHKNLKVGQKYTYTVTPYIYATVGGVQQKVYGKTFKITVTPKVSVSKTKIKSLKGARRSFTVTWKKVSNASGYQIYYKTGNQSKMDTIKGGSKTSAKVKKLLRNRKYTVKVRAYQKVNGKVYYGSWSSAKKVKVK